MADSPIAVFDRLTRVDLPQHTPVLLDTACVLGGSIAGLLAARVLADHARTVVIIERDQVNVAGLPRAGVPQDRQGHGLLPGGLAQIERWLPGLTQEAQDLGAVLVSPDQQVVYLDGHQQVRSGDAQILMGSRPFLESRIRSRVLALPNVSTLSARATGFEYRDDAVSAVRYVVDGVEDVVSVDFVVDAMGRSSKLSEWVEQAGYDRPRLQRLRTGISYATALFERADKPDDLDLACALGQFSPPSSPDGLAVGAVNAIEDDQWLVMLMAYGENQPSRSIEAFRSTCAKMPPIFGEAVSGAVTREILTYHQADSRRRDFAGLSRFPARLVSVGDAVASCNPVYGQGISSAALHASCLSEYLVGNPALTMPAAEFFALQGVVVDAAWTISAGGDAARLDAIAGVEVSEDVRRQRWAMDQLIRATLVDETVAQAFNAVAFMLAHPFSLGDPALVERAVAAHQRASAVS
ncbi:FAD-dependent monooxygenase [Streptomyces mirabilis]|uniref:FAD-dependent monooxygenase n=1 Tax=Streptomyces mirabilis TaxID=68239 RepID=UPI003722A82C